MGSKALVKQQHPRARAKRNASGSWSIVDPFMADGHDIGIGVTPAAAWRDAARSLQIVGKSIKSAVDRFIDWQAPQIDPSKPHSIRVEATANTVRKFARQQRSTFTYRGWLIIPLRPVMTRAQRRAQREENRTCDAVS